MSDLQLKVVQHRKEYDPNRSFKPWIFTLANNVLIDYQRRENNWRRANQTAGTVSITDEYDPIVETLVEHLSTAPDSYDPQTIAAKKDDAKKVRLGLRRLENPNDVEIIRLIYFDGISYKEASERLGIKVGTVKSRLHYAIKKLGESLEGLVEEKSAA